MTIPETASLIARLNEGKDLQVAQFLDSAGDARGILIYSVASNLGIYIDRRGPSFLVPDNVPGLTIENMVSRLRELNETINAEVPNGDAKRSG